MVSLMVEVEPDTLIETAAQAARWMPLHSRHRAAHSTVLEVQVLLAPHQVAPRAVIPDHLTQYNPMYLAQ